MPTSWAELSKQLMHDFVVDVKGLRGEEFCVDNIIVKNNVVICELFNKAKGSYLGELKITMFDLMVYVYSKSNNG